MTDQRQRAAREYEAFVRDIIEAAARADGVESPRVLHDVRVRGLGRVCQIDVLWEFRLGGMDHRVIFDAKHFAGTVEVGVVNQLQGVLTEFPGARGAIVTNVGFQDGAISTAQRAGIGLYVVRPPTEEDLKGRLRVVEGTIEILRPELLRFRPNVIASPEETAAIGSGPMTFEADIVRIVNHAAGRSEDINDLWNRLMHGRASDLGVEVSVREDYDDALLCLPNRTPLRLGSVELTWVLHPARDPFTFRHDLTPDAVMQDVIAGVSRLLNRPR